MSEKILHPIPSDTLSQLQSQGIVLYTNPKLEVVKTLIDGITEMQEIANHFQDIAKIQVINGEENVIVERYITRFLGRVETALEKIGNPIAELMSWFSSNVNQVASDEYLVDAYLVLKEIMDIMNKLIPDTEDNRLRADIQDFKNWVEPLTLAGSYARLCYLSLASSLLSTV